MKLFALMAVMLAFLTGQGNDVNTAIGRMQTFSVFF